MFLNRVANLLRMITHRSLELATLLYHVNRSPLEDYVFKKRSSIKRKLFCAVIIVPLLEMIQVLAYMM